jgi:hypothetical protein
VLPGNVAVRAGKKVAWEAARRTVARPKSAAFVKPEFRKGWEV